MKNKIIIPTILSLLVGSYLGFVIFNQYKNTSETVFSEAQWSYLFMVSIPYGGCFYNFAAKNNKKKCHFLAKFSVPGYTDFKIQNKRRRFMKYAA